jgi:hypothetical protein
VPNAELAPLRSHVSACCARLISALSRIRLPEVTQLVGGLVTTRLKACVCEHVWRLTIKRVSSAATVPPTLAQFLARLEERVAPRKDEPLGATAAAALRAQLLRLCQGMRAVTLGFADDAQLVASTEFLRRAHPLNHTAPVKKSQAHHALCEMLADALRPLVRANQPAASAARLSAPLLVEWHAQVLRVKNEVGQWVNKHSKHINVSGTAWPDLGLFSSTARWCLAPCHPAHGRANRVCRSPTLCHALP